MGTYSEKFLFFLNTSYKLFSMLGMQAWYIMVLLHYIEIILA